MSVLTILLRESYDLQEERGEETAYWHLQKLRQAIKDEQIKGETLPVDSVSHRLTQLNSKLELIEEILSRNGAVTRRRLERIKDSIINELQVEIKK